MSTGRHTIAARHGHAIAFLIALLAALGALAVAGTAHAANPSATLDQCANDPAPSPSTDGCSAAASDWVNGNLGASKSSYLEGDSIPYRLKFGNLSTSGTRAVTIEWDTTKGGTHAIDYLTTFNRTVATANPCLGVSGCNSAVFDSYAIPPDPQVTGAGVTPVAGTFRLYGGDITSVSVYSYADGSGFSGDKSARITINFTASVANPVLAWGGHIATREDWGPTGSAVNIPGSPYHTRLIDLDGAGGNQDRSLSAEAVIYPAQVTVVKDAVPNDAQNFSFTTTNLPTPTSFNLDDDADGTLSNTQPITNIIDFPNTPPVRTVVEGAAAGWDLTALACTDDITQGSVGTANLGTRTASFTLAEGQNITCVFTNTKRGTIIVEKQTNPAGAAGSFAFTGDAAGTISDNGQITVTSLAPGTYTSTEGASAAFNLTNIVCDDTDSTGNVQTRTATFHLQAAETVKCTFTNSRRPKIELVKDIAPNSDPGLFDLFIKQGQTAIDSATDQTDGGSTGANTVDPGSYDLSEAGGTGTTLANYDSTLACTGATPSNSTGTSGTVTLAYGDAVVCTFTNTRRPDFVITKTATPNPANFGQEISYTIEVSHIGENLPIDLSNFDVTDKFADQNVTEPLFREPGDDIGNDGMLSQGEVWSYGVLDAQENWGPLKRTADVCADIVNTATIAPTLRGPAPADAQNPPVLDDPGNRFDTETVPVICTPDLQVVKTSELAQVNFNDTITFTVAVSHAATSDGSPVAGANVKVTDPKVTQGELLLVSGDDQDAVLELGETWIYQVTVDQKVTLPATTCGPITNTAILAQVPGETNLENNASTATVTVICTLDLGIQKTSDKDVYDAGQTINYTVTVTNNGQQAIPFSQIQVADPTATLTLQGAAPADLAPGASLVYTAQKATTAADCAQVVNTATVTYTGPNGPETTTANNSATRTVSVVCPAPQVLIAGTPAKLAIDKRGPLAATAGQLVTYRIKVTNTGQQDALNVVIRDTLPSGFTLARRAAGATFKGGVVTWKVGTLAVGKSKTVKLTVRIDKAIGGRRCNTGSARGSNVGQVRDAACTRIKAIAPVITPAVTG